MEGQLKATHRFNLLVDLVSGAEVILCIFWHIVTIIYRGKMTIKLCEHAQRVAEKQARKRYLATQVLGACYSGRIGLFPSSGLHPLQSC